MSPGGRRFPPELKYILLLFVVTRLVLTIVGVTARQVMPPSADRALVYNYTPHNWLNIWTVYDSKWYLEIAQQGYPHGPNIPEEPLHAFAFFPLYPLLTKILSSIIGNFYLAAILIANAALITSAWFLYKLVYTQFGEPAAKRTILFLFLFPTSFIFSAVYTESLFLLLTLMTLYFARRGHWVIASTCGLLASLTRSLGMFLVVPLAYEYWRSRKNESRPLRWNVLTLFLPILGFLLYAAGNRLATGSWLTFIQVQTVVPWNRTLGNPIWFIVQGLASHSAVLKTWAVVATVSLAALLAGWRRLGTTLAITGALFIIVPLATGLLSMLRFTAVVFPLFILLGLMTKNKLVAMAVAIILIPAQIVLMSLWTNAYYVMI